MGSDDFEDRRQERQWRGERHAEFIKAFRKRVGNPDLDGLSPQAIHHWHSGDQVDALVEAGLGEPALGFMSALLATCSLPRTDPGDAHQYVRHNGPFRLYLSRNGEELLPFGILPRLLLAWICTEVVRTRSQELYLGPSLASFMRELGVRSSDSAGRFGVRTRVREQMHRLFGATLRVEYESKVELRSRTVTGPIADETDLWWQPRQFRQVESWRSTVHLGHRFFSEVLDHPVPIDLKVLRAMKRSSLGVDVYLWLTYRLFQLREPVNLSWPVLYRQFGSDPGRASGRAVDYFRSDMLRELVKLKMSWPGLRYRLGRGFLQLRPSIGRIRSRSSTD